MDSSIPNIKGLREASEITGLPYGCLRRWCLQGKIVFVKADSKYLINMDKLAEFLNKGEQDEEAGR